MRLLIERVKKANCIIDGISHSSIDEGLLVYVAFTSLDNKELIDKAVSKLIKLRIFSDSNDKMNLSVKDVNGMILVISSFSLYGDTKGNNRPSFTKSLSYNDALPLYNYFISKLENEVIAKTGVFGADMKIEAINDGPVSIIMDL